MLLSMTGFGQSRREGEDLAVGDGIVSGGGRAHEALEALGQGAGL